jgi:signal peptidase I
LTGRGVKALYARSAVEIMAASDDVPNKEKMSKEEQGDGWGEILRTMIYAIIIALGIRTIAFEPFNIPSKSMEPTLLVGDYLFVSKYAYGYSRYSIPFGLPLFKGRIFESPVKRGDVAVFKWPFDNSTDYIKRIVGVPGDRIQVRNGILYINDQEVKRTRVDDFIEKGEDGSPHHVAEYLETMPNGVSYDVLDREPDNELDNTRVFTVPPDHYFAMGDNRDNSADSRLELPRGVGFVPAENLVGRAEVLFFSTDGSARWWQFWKWPTATRWSRMFTSLRPHVSKKP